MALNLPNSLLSALSTKDRAVSAKGGAADQKAKDVSSGASFEAMMGARSSAATKATSAARARKLMPGEIAGHVDTRAGNSMAPLSAASAAAGSEAVRPTMVPALPAEGGEGPALRSRGEEPREGAQDRDSADLQLTQRDEAAGSAQEDIGAEAGMSGGEGDAGGQDAQQEGDAKDANCRETAGVDQTATEQANLAGEVTLATVVPQDGAALVATAEETGKGLGFLSATGAGQTNAAEPVLTIGDVAGATEGVAAPVLSKVIDAAAPVLSKAIDTAAPVALTAPVAVQNADLGQAAAPTAALPGEAGALPGMGDHVKAETEALLKAAANGETTSGIKAPEDKAGGVEGRGFEMGLGVPQEGGTPRGAVFSAVLEGFAGAPGLARAHDILSGLDRPVAAAALAHRQADVQRPTPLQMLPVEIGMQAVRGAREFQIRLDPAELGRVDVKLNINEQGEVNASLVVERPETLQMLRRDAQTLAQAFDQAGLKQGENALSFSLRGENQQGQQQEHRGSQRGGVEDDPALGAQINEIVTRRVMIPNSSLDLMV